MASSRLHLCTYNIVFGPSSCSGWQLSWNTSRLKPLRFRNYLQNTKITKAPEFATRLFRIIQLRCSCQYLERLLGTLLKNKTLVPWPCTLGVNGDREIFEFILHSLSEYYNVENYQRWGLSISRRTMISNLPDCTGVKIGAMPVNSLSKLLVSVSPWRVGIYGAGTLL